jgi:4'-phosphopantetheinyl transferase EntD
MTPGGPVARLEAALRSLFPAQVAVAVERIMPDRPDPPWPEEQAAIAGAVPTRRAEFAAGRAAARCVLMALGQTPVALPMGPDRAAIWPDGVVGSIAHAAGFAVAVARSGKPLGVDLEEDAPIAPDLWPILCLPEELRRLTGDDTGRLVRQLYAAKEAVFKAQEAGQRAMFGHEVLSVTLAERGFNAQFTTDAGAFRAGQVVHGKLAVLDGLVLAGVAW